MAQVRVAQQELVGKVIYWGGSGAGTTANLHWLGTHAPADDRGALLQLASETERSQPFEFLPLAPGSLGDWRLRLHLYSVPTHPEEGATRAALLHDADAVIFVADARPHRQVASQRALAELRGLLARRAVPLVVQSNWHRAADAATPTALLQALKLTAQPHVAADVPTGEGVVATLQAATTALLQQL